MTTEAEMRISAEIAEQRIAAKMKDALIEKQAAEIKRLGAENGRWIDLAGHWAQECKTEQRLSFRDQVGKLEAEIERLKAEVEQAKLTLSIAWDDKLSTEKVLRQALESLENSVDEVWAEYEQASMLYGNYPTRQAKLQGMRAMADAHTAAIAAIKQHLGEA